MKYEVHSVHKSPLTLPLACRQDIWGRDGVSKSSLPHMSWKKNYLEQFVVS